MERELVTEEQLLAWLNAELAKHDQCDGCRFNTVSRLAEEDAAGCNWTMPGIRCSGVPSQVCAPFAKRVAARAMEKFNLK